MDTKRSLWPGWETVRVIGRGGFGTVYEIERTQHGIAEKAALKVISIPQDPNEVDNLRSEGYDADSITQFFSEIADEFIREYGMMAQMKGNANIVYCDDYKIIQQDNGFGWDIYIKMELLTPLVRSMDRVSTEEQIIRFGMDMCRALEVCQKRNVIHRDIKPQNIFVSADGIFKLGDFGVAKTVEKTTRGAITGTYHYMAPEVYNNKPYNSTVDIYSLGLVLYWMLNERRSPFTPLPPERISMSVQQEAQWRRLAGEQIPAPKNGSEALKAIVLKACAFDPKDRYQSAREMGEDLQRLSQGQTALPAFQPVVIACDEEAGKTMPAPRKEPAQPVKPAEPVWIENDEDEKTVAAPRNKPAEPANEESKPKKAWSVAAIAACLMAVIVLVLSALPKIQAYREAGPRVFGSKYQRDEIASITFLDTTKDMPADSWEVPWNRDSTVLAWVKPNGEQYDLFIGAEGGVLAPEDCARLFSDYSNLRSIHFNGAFDTSNVTDMYAMFNECSSLTELDMSGFNTSKVMNMGFMFSGCSSLTELDVSGFDTSRVMDMGAMFQNCSSLTELDVSRIDISSATDMSWMFNGCGSLTELDVSNFDTSKVLDMSYMFYNCNDLTELDVSNFDISKVEDYTQFMDEGRTINGRPWEEFFKK